MAILGDATQYRPRTALPVPQAVAPVPTLSPAPAPGAPAPTPQPSGARSLTDILRLATAAPAQGAGTQLARPGSTAMVPPGAGSTLTAANIPGVPGTQPPTPPGAQEPFSDFGPGNDLRGTQINPAANPRLQDVQSQVDILRNRLTGAPDLTQAGLERMRVFEEESERPFQERLRGLGQRFAALGRIGSGQNEVELGRALNEREADLSRNRRLIAGELASQEGQERRANVGTAADIERQLYGQGGQGRDELREERAYQDLLARRAMEDALLRGGYERQEADRSQQAVQGMFASQAPAPAPAATGIGSNVRAPIQQVPQRVPPSVQPVLKRIGDRFSQDRTIY